MGYLQIQIVTLLTVLSASPAAPAPESGQVKEFPNYRCRLVLPGPQFQWLDHGRIRDAQAALGDPAGTILTFLIYDAPSDFAFDETFIRGLEQGFQQTGQVTRIDGGMTTFQDLPCYQMHARIEGRGLFMTHKCFAVNGFLYGLQLLSPELPTRDSPLEKVFSAFQFIGTPLVPPPRSLAKRRAFDDARLIAKLAGGLLLLLAAILTALRVRRKKAPLAPPPTIPDSGDSGVTSDKG